MAAAMNVVKSKHKRCAVSPAKFHPHPHFRYHNGQYNGSETTRIVAKPFYYIWEYWYEFVCVLIYMKKHRFHRLHLSIALMRWSATPRITFKSGNKQVNKHTDRRTDGHTGKRTSVGDAKVTGRLLGKRTHSEVTHTPRCTDRHSYLSDCLCCRCCWWWCCGFSLFCCCCKRLNKLSQFNI